MDGVVHPNVEQAIGRDRIRKALKRYENRPADEHRYGIVRSVNDDGSYEVLLDGDVQTSRCAQYGTALVGDRVLAVTKKDGRNDLIGRLGGETIAPTIAERFEKLEVDYIVAHGTSGIWTWRKWASGVAECWGEVSKLQTLNNAWGNLYTAGSGYFTRQSYPFAFSDRPQEIVTGHWPDNLSWAAAESGSGLNTTTQSAAYNVIRNGDVSGYTGTSYLHLYVIGRWK